ncbi:MAG: thioredoxin domain-containing protein, partial [bacterium]
MSSEQANGIKWREWSDEAFEAAQKLDKPVLLAIGATWCHWCHVMDHTSYADPAVIDIINREFIPVRVDTDRRPDVNERYNLGGWPTTAFLTPRGDLLTGGTYISPEQMRLIIQQVSQAYRQHKVEIYTDLLRQQKEKKRDTIDLSTLPPLGEAASAVQEALMKGLLRNADPVNGGFGTAPKVPSFPALRACLAHYYFIRDDRFRDALVRTLDAMGVGGMYDPVEGGFFRYSTTEDWKVPHFEKMTEDLSQFIPVYLNASVVLGNTTYKGKALDVIRYVLNTLYDPQSGAFFGSQDADEQYYALPLDERKKRAAPFVDKTIYVNWNGRMISAFLRAHQVTGDPQHLSVGLKALHFLRDKC